MGPHGLTPNPKNLPAPLLQENQKGSWVHSSEPLLTVKAVAKRLGVSCWTVYNLVERLELAHVRVSNAIRIPPASLAAFLETPSSEPSDS